MASACSATSSGKSDIAMSCAKPIIALSGVRGVVLEVRHSRFPFGNLAAEGDACLHDVLAWATEYGWVSVAVVHVRILTGR